MKNLNKKKRPICGVVAAEANSIEQRQIIEGIVSQNQLYGIDTAVISNIYNPNVKEQELYCENRIYDLILSEDLDSIILISESFVNDELRKYVTDYIFRKTVPVVVIGNTLDGLTASNCIYINTSDENDIKDVTNHLIEEHGLTDIHLLTGYDFVKASQLRVKGYKKALESHGIEYDPEKVFYGNFWMNSGEDMAEKYADGTIKLPEGIVCANDYMAYGLIDKFSELGISVPKDVMIAGYEFVGGRELHAPVLTTYQRNREALGRAAAETVYNKLNGIDISFSPPRGQIIKGGSCTCGSDTCQLRKELKLARVKKDFEHFNLFNPLDQKLTNARTLDEFMNICGSFQWQVRSVNDIMFCLYKNWYDAEAAPSEFISCRSIVPWSDIPPFEMGKLCIGEFLSHWDIPCVYYFTPLFCNDRMFGYSVLKYDCPDTYDDIYRNWIKSVSNGLEFLRMKNDIKYLTQCQNLSESRDTLTGMFNENGIRSLYQTVIDEDISAVMIILRVCLSSDTFSDLDGKIAAIVDAAEAVRQFCGSQEISGRVNDNTYICVIREDCMPETAADKLSSVLLQHKVYMEKYGPDSFLCAAVECEGRPYNELYKECCELIEEKNRHAEEMRNQPHYAEMLKIRSYIYMNPQESFEPEKLRKLYPYSAGHLRELYKKCFGVSIHQDCISARISRAKYYLTATPMNMAEIAERCGYVDSKYFLRQFMSSVGMTPGRYRNASK